MQKKALVIRYGAYGDVIMITPIFRFLKEEGYHVTFNYADYSRDICKYNPYIDVFEEHVTNSVPQRQLGEYWAEKSKAYDRMINLSESVEQTLLKREGTPEFDWSHERRHTECNVNYMDRTMAICGWPERKGLLPEMHFSPEEEAWGRKLAEQYKNRFVILWSLSGSSFHKVWHGADDTARTFLDRHPDALTITVGGELEGMLEWDHSQNRKKCGIWSIRRSMIMTKYVNLVVGTETGIMHAASAFDTPKIIMLSHSSEENLPKYWTNCQSLHANVPCYPCHQLHYTIDSCPLGTISADVPLKFSNKEISFRTREEYPVCMAKLAPDVVYNALESAYRSWKEGAKTWQPQHSQLQPLS